MVYFNIDELLKEGFQNESSVYVTTGKLTAGKLAEQPGCFYHEREQIGYYKN